MLLLLDALGGYLTFQDLLSSKSTVDFCLTQAMKDKIPVLSVDDFHTLAAGLQQIVRWQVVLASGFPSHTVRGCGEHTGKGHAK